MKLVDLLMTYRQLSILDEVLSLKEEKEWIKIDKKENGYYITALESLHSLIGALPSFLMLDEKLKPVKSSCGCLEFYRKKECVHTTILYALALKVLAPLEYKKQLMAYQKKRLALEQGQILNKLADELRTSASYFNKIHLSAEISQRDNSNFLSLHIGYDKEYVIKNISEFVENMESNRFFSYGQKLAFTHSYEVLDDESKEFYSFLTNLSHENYVKNIPLKRSQLLKVLEIYHQSGIYYSQNGEHTAFYPIVDVSNIPIVLDDKFLYIDKPTGSIELICGVNYAYFLGKDRIYAYRFEKRNEALIFSALFKSSEKSLWIETVEKDFIAKLLPVLKQEVLIEESFYQRFSLPPVVIQSYFSYVKGNILGDYKVSVEPSYSNTPYVNQILEGYIQCLESFGFTKDKDTYLLTKPEEQYFFLTNDISALKNYGEVFFDSSIKRITLKKSNRTSINISYKVGFLDFHFDGKQLSLEEVQAMLMAYHQKKNFVKLKNDVILKIEEKDVKGLDNFLEDFNIDTQELTKPIQKPINYILKLAGGNEDNVELDDDLVSMVDKLQNYTEFEGFPPTVFTDILRPYQIEGFKWLKTLSSFGFGGILADDMGLGKTLEILSFLASDTVARPSLIVCPMSLVYNWENECQKWNFNYEIILIIGSASEREAIIQKMNFKKKTIYITSYDSLRRDIDLYKETFRFIIADEAQYIKNQNALKATAIKRLKSEMNFALTGTPIENGLADLWSIFDFVMPGYLADYTHFKNRYEALIMHDDYEALDLLKKRIQPFILRRTKKDVLKELPDKLEQIYYCKLNEEQKKLYEAYIEEVRHSLSQDKGMVLAMLTRLRQICITPELIYDKEFQASKLTMAVELIKRGLASKHRILLFSQFASVFPILSRMLEEEGIPHYVMDGQTSALKRLELVDDFNHNSSVGVFMISLKTGSTGLNLIGADMVIHLDPWWNLSAENQATDRAYRMGQTKKVFVLKLVCKDTIEEKVIKLQKLKSELSDSIIHTQGNRISLTREDVLALLED